MFLNSLFVRNIYLSLGRVKIISLNDERGGIKDIVIVKKVECRFKTSR